MRRGPTYYDHFGVRPGASAEEIRSAYLCLMKQHHPDLAARPGDGRDGGFAAVLNRSYDVLKDPSKRACYDEFLASESRSWRKRRVRSRALLTGQSTRRRESGWDPSSKATAALGATIMLLIGAAIWAPQGPTSRSNEGASAAAVYGQAAAAAMPAAAAVAAPASRPADGEAVADDPPAVDPVGDVRRAMSETPEEAQAESEQCFASARRTASSALAERCVLFDDAYVEWNRTSSAPIDQPAYFAGSVVRFRHGAAMAAAGLGADRLDELRQAALKALLEEIRAEMNARGTRGPDRPDPDADLAPASSH
jgi:hypothetical protein